MASDGDEASRSTAGPVVEVGSSQRLVHDELVISTVQEAGSLPVLMKACCAWRAWFPIVVGFGGSVPEPRVQAVTAVIL